MRKFIRYRRAWPLLKNASPSIPCHSRTLSIVTSDRALLSSELQCRGLQFKVKSFYINPVVSPPVATVTSEDLLSFLPPRSTGSSQQYGRTLQPCSVPDTVQRRLSLSKYGTLFVTPLLTSSHSQVRGNSSLAPLISYDRVFCTDEGYGARQSERLEEKDFHSSSRSDAVCSDLSRGNQIRSTEGGSPGTNSTSEVSLEPNEGRVPQPQKKVSLFAGLKFSGSSKPVDDYVGIKTGALYATGREITASIKRDDSKHWEKEGPRQWRIGSEQPLQGFRMHVLGPKLVRNVVGKSALSTRCNSPNHMYSTDGSQVSAATKAPEAIDHSQRAVVVALCCNFLVFSLKVGVWIVTSSHVMLAESIHSLADLANQGLLAYGLISSRRAPDALHPYGYTKERFVWSLISAVGIFCLGSGATIVHGVQNLWSAEPLENIMLAAAVIAGSAIMEGASFVVAYGAVKKGASAEGMTMREYVWRGHDPTSVAVLMEDGAAVAGLAVAGLALAAVEVTGNPIWDPIGSIVVGNLLGVVAVFLIQRNRQALLGRSIDDVEMRRVINLLIADPVVEGLYDCKSEVIGPGAYRFKAEIDFDGVVIVQNYLQRAGRDTWMREFREAVNHPDGSVLDRVMAEYGEEVVSALGCEVDRLEKEIQRIVPGIRHVDIEAHNPNGPAPREKFYLSAVEKMG